MIYPEISSYLNKALQVDLTEDRMAILQQIIEYITSNTQPRLNFICTHNSRRSHLSQVWAQVCAYHFGIPVDTFSGGTEATALHPNAVAALRRAGFKIMNVEGNNPKYRISYGDDREPMICYSKTYDDPINPQTDFAAVLTCSDADEACPIVHGADARIKLFYEDPKIADGTAEEAKTYDERCAQIASEMHYVFSKIKS